MNKLTNNKLRISFLPWAELGKSIKLGPITFWPYFGEDNQNKIADPEIKAYLNKLLNLFVDFYKGKPVKTITICSYNNKHLYKLTDSVYETLRFAVDILIFTSIAPARKTIVSNINHSGGWAPPTADIFELYSFPLPNSLKDDFVAFRAGNSINLFKIGDFNFHKPFATGGIFSGPDEELIAGFDRCFSDDFPENIRERILRSLEWFRLAHVEGADVSALSKVVMMATAFEILLKFPKNSSEKKNYFTNYIKEHIASENFIKENRKIYNKNYEKTLAEFWAWDFYNLRSSIVHGDNVSYKVLIYKNSLSHLIVADLVFLECMMQVLLDHECISNNIRSLKEKCAELLLNNKPEDNIKKSLAAKWFWDADDVHKALGWIS
jgi:hypothetical protein